MIPGEKNAPTKTQKELTSDVKCGQSSQSPATTLYCPKGFLCQRGMNDYYCKDERAESKPTTHGSFRLFAGACSGFSCTKNIRNFPGLVEQGYADTCPDGSKTRGVFGKNCKEMYCSKDENCQQVNKFFAKCCKNKTSLERQAQLPKPTWPKPLT